MAMMLMPVMSNTSPAIATFSPAGMMYFVPHWPVSATSTEPASRVAGPVSQPERVTATGRVTPILSRPSRKMFAWPRGIGICWTENTTCPRAMRSSAADAQVTGLVPFGEQPFRVFRSPHTSVVL